MSAEPHSYEGWCVVESSENDSLHCSTHDVTFRRGDAPPPSCAVTGWITPKRLAFMRALHEQPAAVAPPSAPPADCAAPDEAAQEIAALSESAAASFFTLEAALPLTCPTCQSVIHATTSLRPPETTAPTATEPEVVKLARNLCGVIAGTDWPISPDMTEAWEMLRDEFAKMRDFANVSRETLGASSVQHIGDVRVALGFFAQMIHRACWEGC